MLYVGDDTTDEDGFRAAADRGAGVLVAEQPRPSEAAFRVADPAEVRALLQRLVDRYHVGP